MTVPSSESVAMKVYEYQYHTNPDKGYEISFKFLGLDENISAFLRMADGSVMALIEGTHFEVIPADGNSNVWGVFKFKTSSELPAESDVEYVCIYRKIDNSQEKRFDSQTVFSSTTEFALDKLTMLIQDYVSEKKYIRVPVDTNITKIDLELPPVGAWKDGAPLGFVVKEGIYKLAVLSETTLNINRTIRQPTSETIDDSFEIPLDSRKNKILGFNDEGSVEFSTHSINVQSDWSQADNTKDDYIKNKPTIPAAQQPSDWNSTTNPTQILNKPGNATTTVSGFMSAGDKTKLDGVQSGAEVNVQSDWSQADNTKDDYIKNKPTIPGPKESVNHTAGDGITFKDFSPRFFLSEQMGSDISGSWLSVTYGNGTFVAVATTSNIAATSPDGITWTQRTMPVTAYWKSVIYGNGTFVAVADDTIAATSPDGITWTQRTMPVTAYWKSVTYGNGVFVAVARSGGAATSPDGITWTQRTMPVTAYWESVTYGNGTFVAVTYNSNTAATSPDGITWTQRTLPANARWQSVAYGNGTFVAVADDSTTAATSPDGITWTPRTMPVTAYWRSVTYGNGVFVAVTYNNNTAATSPDGITWTQRTMPITAAWGSIICGKKTFVAVAYDLNKAIVMRY